MNSSRNYKAPYVLYKRRFYTAWFWGSVIVFFADLTVVLLLVRRIILSDGATLFATAGNEKTLMIVMAGGTLLLPILFVMIGFNRYKQVRWRSYRKPAVRYTR